MTKRVRWLTLGAALGAGGAVWSQRRLAALAERARTGAVSGDVVRLVDRGSRRVGRHVASSVATGRAEARRREVELRRQVEQGGAVEHGRQVEHGRMAERRPSRPFAG